MKHKIYQGTFKKSYDVLIQSTKLNSSQKLLIQLVLSWQGEEKQCFQTNKSISENLGLSIRGLDKIITSLNKLTFFQSMKNVYNNGKLMTINEDLLFDFLNDGKVAVEEPVEKQPEIKQVNEPVQPAAGVNTSYQLNDVVIPSTTYTSTATTVNSNYLTIEELEKIYNNTINRNDIKYNASLKTRLTLNLKCTMNKLNAGEKISPDDYSSHINKLIENQLTPRPNLY